MIKVADSCQCSRCSSRCLRFLDALLLCCPALSITSTPSYHPTHHYEYTCLMLTHVTMDQLPCCHAACLLRSSASAYQASTQWRPSTSLLPSAAADARVLSSYHTIIVLFNSDESLHAAPHEFHDLPPTTISAYRTSTTVLVLVGWLPLLLGRLQQAANRLAIADGTADGPSRGALDRSERPLKTICPPVGPLQFRSCRGGREHHIMRGNPWLDVGLTATPWLAWARGFAPSGCRVATATQYECSS